MQELTEEQVEEWKRRIDGMSQEEMARLWRFAPSGHPCFIIGTPVTEYFQEKFNEKGGMTPGISKKIGW